MGRKSKPITNHKAKKCKIQPAISLHIKLIFLLIRINGKGKCWAFTDTGNLIEMVKHADGRQIKIVTWLGLDRRSIQFPGIYCHCTVGQLDCPSHQISAELLAPEDPAQRTLHNVRVNKQSVH